MTNHRIDGREMAGMSCEGWWEQDLLGRQPMRDLRLRFEAGQVIGSGHDIVGLFTLRGTIAADGAVIIVKHYLGMHTVRYVGHYDGEGLMWGQWWIGPLHNRWLIKIKRSNSHATTEVEMEAVL